jgi:acid phosphatase class B
VQYIAVNRIPQSQKGRLGLSCRRALDINDVILIKAPRVVRGTNHINVFLFSPSTIGVE